MINYSLSLFFGSTSETILQYSIIDYSVRQTHMTNISLKIEIIHSINCYVEIFSVCAINCKFHNYYYDFLIQTGTNTSTFSTGVHAWRGECLIVVRYTGNLYYSHVFKSFSKSTALQQYCSQIVRLMGNCM